MYTHLSGKDPHGRDVVGIYPIFADETCRFLAVDFDEEDFRANAVAFYRACSGQGAHVWIFSQKNIPAALARKMGSAALTYAMDVRCDIAFSSYDRFFPNEDTTPDGGFGNLIALPLQGQARKKGNSVFADQTFTMGEATCRIFIAIRKRPKGRSSLPDRFLEKELFQSC